MTIIEVKDKTNFEEWMNNVDKSRYRMIITETGKIILRPLVSSRNLDTVVLVNVNKEDMEGFVKLWGKVLRCSDIHFTDEVRYL